MWLMVYLRLIQTFLQAYWTVWFEFPRLNQAQKMAAIQTWSRQALSVMGVELASESPNQKPVDGVAPTLWVANHVSWLDILVIQAIHPCVFVAKSEVVRWPVLGRLAQACGVIFVDRQSASGVRQMVHQVIDVLNQGLCVAAFPEGTTSAGHTVGVFHANVFEAAIHHHLAVQPIALHYSDSRTACWCPQAAFVDDMGLIGSLHQIIQTGGIRASARMAEPLSAIGHSRRTLAHLSHQTVSAHLRVLQQSHESCCQ